MSGLGDLHARLCDVTPLGRVDQHLPRDRASHDAATDNPQPVEFDLLPAAHAYRRGHRSRLQVSGGAHRRSGRSAVRVQLSKATAVIIGAPGGDAPAPPQPAQELDLLVSTG